MKQKIRIPVFLGPRGRWIVPSYEPNDPHLPTPYSEELRLVLVVAEIDVLDVQEIPGAVESPPPGAPE